MESKKLQEKPVPARASRQTWQEYQAALKRRNTRKQRARGITRWGVLLLVLAASFYGLSVGIDGFSSTPTAPPKPRPAGMESDGPQKKNTDPSGLHLRPDQDPALWNTAALPRKIQPEWRFAKDGKEFLVQTTLNPVLQAYLDGKLDRELPKQVAIVVLEPSTGRILALAGHDRVNPENNPCLESEFPAASIFKIVIASAVVEERGFTPGTPLYYNGGKYTLYKSQLKNKKNKYTRRVTLKNAFAQSVNPVFGKLGIHHLDMAEIENYARAFGFETPIEFELGESLSRLFVSEEPYHRAEIASGFNRKTTISPVHGALIASTALNGGKLMAPAFIRRVTNGSGKTIYQGRPSEIGRAVTPETASVLAELMQATVRFGTARKAFRGYRYDKVLSELVIGGKTGSISNLAHTSKYDWFVGFAKDKTGGDGIAVSVLVVHGDLLGRRAGSYAKMAIKAYYEDYFSQKTAASGKSERS